MVFGMDGNQGIRLVSGSGFVVFLSKPPKPLAFRLVTRRDLEFFVRILQVYHSVNVGIPERMTDPPRGWTTLGLSKTLQRVLSGS
jgi:hypothetical protein